MTRLGGVLFALLCLGCVLLRPIRDFVTQAVLGHSPLNPKEIR